MIGSDISKLLIQCHIDDTSGQSTKWRRLEHSFIARQSQDQSPNAILSFVQKALSPVKFVNDQNKYDVFLLEVNKVLMMVGCEVCKDGSLRTINVAYTIDEVKYRTDDLYRPVEKRVVPCAVRKRPFMPYSGNESYIFISYAHKDSEMVFPIIKQLHEMGYPIWYDEGITPGAEWPEFIAEHLSHASFVLLFVSPNSMASNNVKRELVFTQKKDIPMICIHLQKTVLPKGIEMQLGLNQQICYYKYESEAIFFNDLTSGLPKKLVDNKK